MCSLHPRLARKLYEMIDEVRARITTEVADNDMLLVKQVKRRGIDEMSAIKECASAERYLKILNSPTPNVRNVAQIQKHLDDMIKELRR